MLHTILAATLLAVAEPDSVINLSGVTVSGKARHDYQTQSSQSGIRVSHDYLRENLSGSLMQTLEHVPGVRAMKIGSGQSKPAIRGLGFNRMVVAENGIKHEGQQWGDDHGLEIDQFAIDRIDIVKGPAAILYGSDAIGGVIDLYSNNIPMAAVEASANLFCRSNNDLIGLAAKVGGRHGNWFYKANVTASQYADYKVPTDSIQYYSYYIKLDNRRLRNTAGRERDLSAALGYNGYNLNSTLHLTSTYSKSGFFANAHGLEVRLSDIDYDASVRDIDLPRQSVEHLKILSNTNWHNETLSVKADLAYQRNLREELSEPVSHGYMPKPDNPLERRFEKSTFTANANLRLALGEHNELKTGATLEHQHNRRSGWGFIIPDFDTRSFGAFVFDCYTVGSALKLNAGLRYDVARTTTECYTDWYTTPTADGGREYKQRAENLRRKFDSFTWSVGMCYSTGSWVAKANFGKSFRTPIPKELSADGINYHIFRYERGNAALKPEESYQADCSFSFENDVISWQTDPYVNYFPNYIYLCPTPDYVEGLQLYRYTQSEVLRYGIETQANYKIHSSLSLDVGGEYLFARQLSGEKKGYTLPFSTPWSANVGLKYTFEAIGGGHIVLNTNIVGKQSEIVPPEKPTDGHCTLNLALNKHFETGICKFNLSVKADNLLNKRYFDHTSFYRLINVPEAGRNFSVVLEVNL
ncbi:MAG: TonB-dependent receptor [Bacteroidales bacterium]|nr:TonB-dependent receptor [Bacteroidales bacterium]